MKTKFFALMGNAAMAICAFLVKSISAKWAYKYTTLGNQHAKKFLMGVEREVKLLNELAKNPDNLSEIKNHLWSSATKLEILKGTDNENLMKIFVEMMKTPQEWDAAMSNKDNELKLLAYGQKSYTPTEKQIIEQLNLLNYRELKILAEAHHISFRPKVLEHMDADMLNSFLAIAINLDTVNIWQVEFFLKKKNKTPKMKEFIEKFFLEMPETSENTEILEREFPELMKLWANKQYAETLCNCCLERWAAHKNEQGLRIIEEKCMNEGLFEETKTLVKSTKAFYFNDALNFLIRNSWVDTDLLNYVQEESVHHYRLVDELLKHPDALTAISAKQIAKFRDEQKRKYWLKLAETGNLTAKKLHEVPEELREKVIAILEDNSMIAWLQSHSPVNKRDLEFIATKAITPRVQCAMAKRRVDERWIYTIFSGKLFAAFMRNRYRDDISFSNPKEPELLSYEAFRILVDDNRKYILKDYLKAFTAIPEADREYLLCSPLKDMALGVGTIS